MFTFYILLRVKMLRKRPTCPSRDDLWDIAGGRIKKLAFEIKISQYTYDCQASCFIDVNLQWKELRKIGKFLVGS